MLFGYLVNKLFYFISVKSGVGRPYPWQNYLARLISVLYKSNVNASDQYRTDIKLSSFAIWVGSQFPDTVESHYNTFICSHNTHNRRPIARPWGRGMGLLLWVQILSHVAAFPCTCYTQYCLIFDLVISRVHCIVLSKGLIIVLPLIGLLKYQYCSCSWWNAKRGSTLLQLQGQPVA